MSTPSERASVLREIHAQDAARNRTANDRAHMPGSDATVFERTAHWERRTDTAFGALEEAATRWRVARGEAERAGHTPEEDPDVIRLLAERDAAYREYERYRDLRDEALAEYETLRNAARGW